MIACTTVANKDMVNIWALIRIPTASLGVLEPLDLPAVTLSTAGNRICILGIYAVWPSLRFMSTDTNRLDPSSFRLGCPWGQREHLILLYQYINPCCTSKALIYKH